MNLSQEIRQNFMDRKVHEDWCNDNIGKGFWRFKHQHDLSKEAQERNFTFSHPVGDFLFEHESDAILFKLAYCDAEGNLG